MRTSLEQAGAGPQLSLHPGVPRRGRTLAFVLLVALCVEVFFSVPYRSLYLLIGSVSLAWAAGVAGVFGAVILYRFRSTIARPEARWANWSPGDRWFLSWFVLGFGLRLFWAMFFGMSMKADGLTYFGEATSLAVDHRYGGAFFPPGLPLVEAPFLMLFGAHRWVTALVMLLCFTGSYAATYWLGKHVGNRSVAGAACAVVAVWLNSVASTGVNAKETLLMLLITTCFVSCRRGMESRGQRRLLFFLISGMLIGAAALTQPAFLLFWVVILGVQICGGSPLRRIVPDMAILFVGIGLTVLPWTYRNYSVYHRSVLITTNGGSVFYRANNPKANAQYSPEGEQSLSKDEFAASDQGYRDAKKWIRENPGAFAKLAVRKQVVFLGDDSDNVYETMKRGAHPSTISYALFKLLCNAQWLSLMAILLLGAGWVFRSASWPAWWSFACLPLLYQWLIDSIFESGARHHGPYTPILAIAAAFAIWGGRSGQDRPLGLSQEETLVAQ